MRAPRPAAGPDPGGGDGGLPAYRDPRGCQHHPGRRGRPAGRPPRPRPDPDRKRGDNLAATFSPELADLSIHVIDTAAAQDIPRKRGRGVTRSDLLVVNRTDLAPHVGVDLELLEADTKRARGDRPYVMARVGHGVGIAQIVAFLETEGGLLLRGRGSRAERRPCAAWPMPAPSIGKHDCTKKETPRGLAVRGARFRSGAISWRAQPRSRLRPARLRLR